jgi:hypothetical protein
MAMYRVTGRMMKLATVWATMWPGQRAGDGFGGAKDG